MTKATDLGNDGFDTNGQMNVLTTLWNFFTFILFTIIVLLIEEHHHILIFIENIAEYMILPELPQQIKEELLYLLQTASISRSVEGLGIM